MKRRRRNAKNPVRNSAVTGVMGGDANLTGTESGGIAALVAKANVVTGAVVIDVVTGVVQIAVRKSAACAKNSKGSNLAA
jgi:uncharacterized NAD-dependent epimerase/dehydratase family protein